MIAARDERWTQISYLAPPSRTPSSEHQRRHSPDTRCHHELPGVLFMCVLSLSIYFAGGFLFIAYYKSVYPFFDVEVDSTAAEVYVYLGPLLVLLGLLLFIVSCAMLCSLKRPCRSCCRGRPEGGVRVLPPPTHLQPRDLTPVSRDRRPHPSSHRHGNGIQLV